MCVFQNRAWSWGCWCSPAKLLPCVRHSYNEATRNALSSPEPLVITHITCPHRSVEGIPAQGGRVCLATQSSLFWQNRSGNAAENDSSMRRTPVCVCTYIKIYTWAQRDIAKKSVLLFSEPHTFSGSHWGFIECGSRQIHIHGIHKKRVIESSQLIHVVESAEFICRASLMRCWPRSTACTAVSMALFG